MTNLSPAAQAVLDSSRQFVTQAWSDATRQRFNLGIAAALRAAAVYCTRERRILMTIADELNNSAQQS